MYVHTISFTLFLDPPTIVGVRNFTIFLVPNLEQSAVLECKIQHKESDGVNVSVNWTLNNGDKLKKNYSLSRDVNLDVFFLVLYNITEDDVHKYTCQLFSTYSPDIPEDQRTAEISSAGQQINVSFYNYIKAEHSIMYNHYCSILMGLLDIPEDQQKRQLWLLFYF